MPIYEYECAACGECVERLQKLADPPLVDCPACGEPKLQRLISTPAFQFKGSGWYVTDYARKGKERGGEKGKEEGGKGEAGREAKAIGEDKGSGETKESKKPAPAKPADRTDS